MKGNVVQEKIKKVMSHILEVPLESIDEHFTTDSTEKWESLNQIKLVLALEEEFGIRLEEKDIVNANSYESIVGIVGNYTHL